MYINLHNTYSYVNEQAACMQEFHFDYLHRLRLFHDPLNKLNFYSFPNASSGIATCTLVSQV